MKATRKLLKNITLRGLFIFSIFTLHGPLVAALYGIAPAGRHGKQFTRREPDQKRATAKDRITPARRPWLSSLEKSCRTRPGDPSEVYRDVRRAAPPIRFDHQWR